MPRPKKPVLPKQTNTLFNHWQRNAPAPRVQDAPALSAATSSSEPIVPRKRSLSQTESSPQISVRAPVNCPEPRGLDSDPAALSWSESASVEKSGLSSQMICPVSQGKDSDLSAGACSNRDLGKSTVVPTTKVLEGEASQVLFAEASQVLFAEATQVLEGEASQVLFAEANQVLEGEASQVLDDEAQTEDDDNFSDDECVGECDPFTMGYPSDEDDVSDDLETSDNPVRTSGKPMVFGKPIDLVGLDDSDDDSDDDLEDEASSTARDPLDPEWQLIRVLREVLVFLTDEALSMDDMLDWKYSDQPINERTWKLLRTASVDSLVDCFNRAISVETKRIFERRKIRKTDLLGLPSARKESRSGVYAGICKKPSRPTPYVGCGNDISGHVPNHTLPSVWKRQQLVRLYQRLSQGDEVQFGTLVAFESLVKRVYLELIEGIFMFFLGTLQAPKVDFFSRKISTWQLYSKMVSKVDLPWRVNVGDLLNGSWPLATPTVFPEFPEFAPCSNPDCENITRLGYSLSSPEKRHYRVTGDPFSGYICGSLKV
ncbi:hypothetical protein N7467_002628 [Penicillium canescens]|nr:hypothetical protein N7467_002628 [Penicillium canescens]